MAMHGLPQGIRNPPRLPGAPGAPGAGGAAGAEPEKERRFHLSTPGTVALIFVFLTAFVLYYFVNWKLLSGVWQIG